MTSVCLVDHDTGTDPAEIVRAAAALTIQVNQHAGGACPQGWGIAATVRAAAPGTDANPGEMPLRLFKDPDQPGALGYHDRTDDGLPQMHIFPLLDAQDGVPWTVTASHELLETLVDPETNLAFLGHDGSFWAGEVCDAVEQDQYSIGTTDENEVMVSNFVLPSYFSPPMFWANNKLDYLGLCKSPLEIRPGGYGQKFNPGSGWEQVKNAMKAPRSYRLLRHVGGLISRSEQRRGLVHRVI